MAFGAAGTSLMVSARSTSVKRRAEDKEGGEMHWIMMSNRSGLSLINFKIRDLSLLLETLKSIIMLTSYII
jgi:hypothetical protein